MRDPFGVAVFISSVLARFIVGFAAMTDQIALLLQQAMNLPEEISRWGGAMIVILTVVHLVVKLMKDLRKQPVAKSKKVA